jgi:hypothetical protein
MIWSACLVFLSEAKKTEQALTLFSKNLASGFGSEKQAVFGQPMRFFRPILTSRQDQITDLFWPKWERLSSCLP